MREFFALLVLFGGFALGFSAANRLRRREKALCALRQMLLEVKLSLSFGSVPLPVLLNKLSADARFTHEAFLSALTGALQNGEALPEAWKAAAESAASSLGKEVELLSRELAALDGLCESAAKKRQRCGAMYRAAGAFFGFSAFLLVS